MERSKEGGFQNYFLGSSNYFPPKNKTLSHVKTGNFFHPTCRIYPLISIYYIIQDIQDIRKGSVYIREVEIVEQKIERSNICSTNLGFV